MRKGEHSQIVVFWKVDQIANAGTETGPESDEADEKSRRRFVLRYYRLFNLEQCELPQAVLDKLPKIETHQHDPIEAAERIIAGMPNPPEIQYAGSKAFYSPTTDRITLPPRELFTSTEEIYACLFHEESHAAGAPKRLNRKSITEAAPFGSPHIRLRSSSRNVQPLICAPKRESRPPSSRTRLRIFKAGSPSYVARRGWL